MSEPFKNKDLKRLKAYARTNAPCTFEEFRTSILALIARLEASEAGFTEYHGLEMSKGCECRCCKAWRKAAGR